MIGEADAAGLVKLILTTPWPILFMMIGFMMLCVGFGANFSFKGIDLTKLNKTFAKITGAVAFPVGGVAEYGRVASAAGGAVAPKDPWLVYYIVSLAFICALCWIVMRSVNGPSQARTMTSAFLLTGGLVTVAVLWRALSVYFYVTTRAAGNEPFDLQARHSYLPYFVLIALGVLAIVWTIFTYTRDETNSNNRSVIFQSFLKLCSYMLFCRFLWETADWFARKAGIG